jgi:hypothetical protein
MSKGIVISLNNPKKAKMIVVSMMSSKNARIIIAPDASAIIVAIFRPDISSFILLSFLGGI